MRPHLRKRSGRDDKSAGIPARDSGRDESLPHSYFVAEHGATEFVDRAFYSRHRGQLVGLKRDGSYPRVNWGFPKNESRNAGADFFRCR